MKCYYMCAKRIGGGGGRLEISSARENDPSSLFYSFHLSFRGVPSVVVDVDLAGSVSWLWMEQPFVIDTHSPLTAP